MAAKTKNTKPNADIVFTSTHLKTLDFATTPPPLAAFPFARQSLSSHLSRALESLHRFIAPKIPPFRPPLCSSSLSVSRHTKPGGGEEEERVLISEVLIRNRDGGVLERPDLEAAAAAALGACRPNSALTAEEVQEDVHRIIDSGFFSSCMPAAVDTRDGIQLVFQVEPFEEFKGLVCEGASALPARVLEESFGGGYGKMINLKQLDKAIKLIDGWYQERGLTGVVSGAEILSGGIIRLEVSEAEVNNITVQFLDKKTGEPTSGKTKPDIILQQLTTKKGQVYSRQQVNRDVEAILTMGIMEDVTIIPQPAEEDPRKVNLIMNLVERPSGGFSAGGGISSGITNGPLSGLIGSFAYSHRNLFGRNKKLNLSLERGQVESIFRFSYTDPWIDGDKKRTSRTIMAQNCRTPGTLVHGNNQSGHDLTIARVTAGIEYSRPFWPKWNSTAGLVFQRAGVRDDKGNPVIRDFYNSPLTASGNAYDDMLMAKLESVFTDYGDRSSSTLVFNMEQGLPLLPEWLCFNRVNVRARHSYKIGPARLLLSVSGGHVIGKFSPHEAFAIGGTNSVRGYEEGAVGSGRSFAFGSGDISFPMFGPLEGVLFVDCGSDLGSGSSVPGNPAGARGKPGSGCGYGVGVRVDSALGPLRLEFAFNDKNASRFHFGVGYRN